LWLNIRKPSTTVKGLLIRLHNALPNVQIRKFTNKNPMERLSWLRTFMIFLRPSRKMLG